MNIATEDFAKAAQELAKQKCIALETHAAPLVWHVQNLKALSEIPLVWSLNHQTCRLYLAVKSYPNKGDDWSPRSTLETPQPELHMMIEEADHIAIIHYDRKMPEGLYYGVKEIAQNMDTCIESLKTWYQRRLDTIGTASAHMITPSRTP